MNYDSVQNHPGWKNVEFTTDAAFSGSEAGILHPDTKYGLTFSYAGIGKLIREPPVLFISSYLLAENLKDLILVVDMSADGVKFYYRTINLENLVKQNGQWEQTELLFQLPNAEHVNSQLNIFIWNKGGNQVYLDDFTISIYE